MPIRCLQHISSWVVAKLPHHFDTGTKISTQLPQSHSYLEPKIFSRHEDVGTSVSSKILDIGLLRIALEFSPAHTHDWPSSPPNQRPHTTSLRKYDALASAFLRPPIPLTTNHTDHFAFCSIPQSRSLILKKASGFLEIRPQTIVASVLLRLTFGRFGRRIKPRNILHCLHEGCKTNPVIVGCFSSHKSTVSDCSATCD